MSIRDRKESTAERKLKKMYGLCIYERFEESLQTVAEHLGEETPVMETNIEKRKEKHQHIPSWMQFKTKNRNEHENRNCER